MSIHEKRIDEAGLELEDYLALETIEFADDHGAWNRLDLANVTKWKEQLTGLHEVCETKQPEKIRAFILILKNDADLAKLLKRSKKRDAGSPQNPAVYSLPFKEFPLDVFPDLIKGYIQAHSLAKNIDPAFIAVPILGTISAAIGNSLLVQEKRSWVQPCAIWPLTIGKTGKGKSPGLDAALEPINQIDDANTEAYQKALEQYRKEVLDYKQLDDAEKSQATEPKEPRERRVYTVDSTIERIGTLHSENARGICVIHDEAASWLKGMNKYKAGSGEEHVWIRMMEGKPIRIDRNSDKASNKIQSPNVSVIGGIQPKPLQACLNSDMFNSGLVARMILTLPPERKRKYSLADVHEEDQARYNNLIKRIYRRPMKASDDLEKIELNHDARLLFIQFFNWIGEILEDLPDSAFNMFCSKMDRLCLRLALILHAANNESCNPILDGELPRNLEKITAKSMQKSIRLCHWIMYETARVYQLLGFEYLSMSKDEQFVLSMPAVFTWQEVAEERNIRRAAAFRYINKLIQSQLIERASENQYKSLVRNTDSIHRVLENLINRQVDWETLYTPNEDNANPSPLKSTKPTESTKSTVENRIIDNQSLQSLPVYLSTPGKSEEEVVLF